MLDKFNRTINYLRISVTDRCNLRCRYCMPEEGIELLRHEDILSFDEIAAFTEVAVKHGVNKVRITGGEPLVRKGIATLVRMIAGIDGIADFSMTTNGVLLKDFAEDLKTAGLHRVNISLDTIDPEKFPISCPGCRVSLACTTGRLVQRAAVRDVFVRKSALLRREIYPGAPDGNKMQIQPG